MSLDPPTTTPAGTQPAASTPAGAVAKAAMLVEALPYIRRFWGQVVVVKYGGSALAPPGGSPAPGGRAPVAPGGSAVAGGSDPGGNGSDPGGNGSDPGTDDLALASFATDIVLMASVGMRPVVVHGGGPQIGEMMRRLGKVAEFRDGLRVTDAETLEIARMVLVGKVNRDIVSAVNIHAPLAVGVSGEDAGLLRATARDPDLGFVGDVERVNPELIVRLLAEDLIPVVATIGADGTGQAFNINADTAAGAIAAALGAEKLVYLTDVDGIRRDRDDAATLVSATGADGLAALVADGTIAGGMIPKARSCVAALRSGVGRAHILDGRVPHSLLLEIFTNAGVGTMVSP